jgi:hypothetical protein
MLSRDGKIVPIPNEWILHTSRPRVSLEISTPRELQIAEPFSLKCDDGIAYVTNERVGHNALIPLRCLGPPSQGGAHGSCQADGPQVIYLPARAREDFKSFFAPVLNFSDTHVTSSWYSPWSWGGTVRPVPGGGIPTHIPRIEVKFTFRDGGHYEFQNKFEWLKERMHHAQELGLIPGQNLEPPPPYEPNRPGPSSSSAASADASADAQTQQQQPPQPAPDEPPPDYDEVQAQAINMRYEEQMREEAERQ